MEVDVVQELTHPHPPPAGGGIHDLEERSHLPPHEHEVGQVLWQPDDDDGRKGGRVAGQVVARDHHLLRRQPEVDRDLFDRVDRGAVEVRLARLPKPIVAGRDAEALEQ